MNLRTMNLRLYQSDLSLYAARVRILCYAKGLTSLEKLSPPGGSASAEFRRINPLGKLPCLDHDGFFVPESEIICEYLEEIAPEPALLPQHPQQRARARLLSRISDLYISPLFGRLITQLKSRERDAALIDTALAELGTRLEALGQYVEGPRFAVGGHLSIADCTLAPCLFTIDRIIAPGLARSSPLSPHLAAYLNAVLEEAPVARGVGEFHEAIAAEQQALRRRTG